MYLCAKGMGCHKWFGNAITIAAVVFVISIKTMIRDFGFGTFVQAAVWNKLEESRTIILRFYMENTPRCFILPEINLR